MCRLLSSALYNNPAIVFMTIAGLLSYENQVYSTRNHSHNINVEN